MLTPSTLTFAFFKAILSTTWSTKGLIQYASWTTCYIVFIDDFRLARGRRERGGASYREERRNRGWFVFVQNAKWAVFDFVAAIEEDKKEK